MTTVYDKVMEFKKKYPTTIAWRLKKQSEVVEKYLNPGEEGMFAFPGQKGNSSMDFFSTFVVVLTNKRILLAQKRMLWGYTYLVITPDMFNDLTVSTGIIWGKLYIDTIKETVMLSNISKHGMDDIETQITEYMMAEKSTHIVKGQDR